MTSHEVMGLVFCVVVFYILPALLISMYIDDTKHGDERAFWMLLVPLWPIMVIVVAIRDLRNLIHDAANYLK